MTRYSCRKFLRVTSMAHVTCGCAGKGQSIQSSGFRRELPSTSTRIKGQSAGPSWWTAQLARQGFQGHARSERLGSVGMGLSTGPGPL